MQLPNIQTFNGGNYNREHSFYILCKGLNSGKPLRQACPNCFRVTSATAHEADYWFWLSWGLWKSKSFYQYHRGSVIPFIRICDYTQAIETAAHRFINNRELLDRALNTMRDLEQCETATLKKLNLIREMRVAVFAQVLHR